MIRALGRRAFPAQLLTTCYRSRVFDLQIASYAYGGADHCGARTGRREPRAPSQVNDLLTSAALVLGLANHSARARAFIKWKPTVVNWLFAAAFAGSHLIRGPTLIQRMLGQSVTLSDNDWKQLSLMWIVFFIAAGAANLYVAFNYPEATWVNFKRFGLMGLTLVFVVLQGVWLSRRTEHE
jgi:intracellular septation protein A